jgi:hypothetical protein
VHREFWDGVNFKRGANPPREAWKAPPQRTPEETDAAFERFGAYVDHIMALPNVHFVTARELPEQYPDRVRTEGATQEDVAEIALRLAADNAEGVNYAVIGAKAFSPADQFATLADAVVVAFDQGDVNLPVITGGLWGPDGTPPTSRETEMEIPWPAFVAAVRDTRAFVTSQRRVPARVFIGPDAVPPTDFLVGLARFWKAYCEDPNAAIGRPVRLGRNVELLTAKHVAKDTPGLFGGWVIHREGFRAPQILEIARLQAWTLKPSTPKAD